MWVVVVSAIAITALVGVAVMGYLYRRLLIRMQDMQSGQDYLAAKDQARSAANEVLRRAYSNEAETREERKRRFAVITGGKALAAALFVYIGAVVSKARNNPGPVALASVAVATLVGAGVFLSIRDEAITPDSSDQNTAQPPPTSTSGTAPSGPVQPPVLPLPPGTLPPPTTEPAGASPSLEIVAPSQEPEQGPSPDPQGRPENPSSPDPGVPSSPDDSSPMPPSDGGDDPAPGEEPDRPLISIDSRPPGYQCTVGVNLIVSVCVLPVSSSH